MNRRIAGHLSMYAVASLIACVPNPVASAQWISQPSGTTASLADCGPSVPMWPGRADGRDDTPNDRRRPHLAKERRPGRRRARLPRHRGVRRADGLSALDRRRARSRASKRPPMRGKSWRTQHVNRDPHGFLDALAFWDADHGLALGDPVDGRFVVLATDDGGRNWTGSNRRDARVTAGRGGVRGERDLPGRAGEPPRLVRHGARAGLPVRGPGPVLDGHATSVRAGNASSGIFSMAFRDTDRGVAVGGDYKEPARPADVVALTSDGGRTWRPPSGAGPRGYRSAVAVIPGRPDMVVAVGPSGGDWSPDGGETWKPLGDRGFHALALATDRIGWGVGDAGRIGRLDPGGLGRSP